MTKSFNDEQSGQMETLLTYFVLWVTSLIICYYVTFPQIVKLAVYRMLPKNLQRRTLMQRLHLFPEDVSSHAITFSSLVI